jgi:hypothetical protein
MKKIKLSTGEFTMIDDDDFELYGKFKCFPATPKSGKYRYAQLCYEGKTKYLHRVIMKAPQGYLVDHIDGDTLNNQKNNLRIVSQHGNQHNAKGKVNPTGFPNVRKLGNRFQGRVKVMGRKISLGAFQTAFEAYEAVKQFKDLLLNRDVSDARRASR